MEPVLIAGAGPVGCAAALYLAQNDIPVILMEAQKALPKDLRASTFHPPTLDMLAPLGLTDRIKPMGLISPTYQYRDRRTEEVAEFDLSVLNGETDHPYRLQCEQYKMTGVTEEMLADFPHAKLKFEHQVVGFSQDQDGVTALAFTPDGEQKLRGSFLIGAEGADSRTRQSAAVCYDGLTYPERFLVASTTFDFAANLRHLSNVNYVSDPEEWCVLLRTVDLWRVLLPTDPAADPDHLLSDEFIQDRLHHIYDKPGDYDIIHRTLYRVHQRVAETYRIGGRVLLAGDAAHINNPLGGMGMNGGIHDAINLAEKLTQIINHKADMDSLLDLYNRQRRRICIEFVQKQTMENKKLMEATDVNAQRARLDDFMRRSTDPKLAREFLLRTSMINSVRDSYQIQ